MPANASVDRALAALEDNPTKLLEVRIKGTAISKAQFVPRADATAAPVISFAAAAPSSTCLIVSLDLDVPFASMRALGPLVHWIQPGLKATGDDSGTLESDEPFIIDWIAPNPPPGSGPHRYSFFLFEQPEGFDVRKWAPKDGKPVGKMARVRWSLDDWRKRAGAGEALAANWFLSS